MHACNPLAQPVCNPTATAGEHYVNAAAFQQLFVDQRRNFKLIAESLFLMARRIGDAVAFNSEDDRNDAVANVTLMAIQRAMADEAPGDAFSYYTQLIRMRLYNERRSMRRYGRRFQTGVAFEG